MRTHVLKNLGLLSRIERLRRSGGEQCVYILTEWGKKNDHSASKIYERVAVARFDGIDAARESVDAPAHINNAVRGFPIYAIRRLVRNWRAVRDPGVGGCLKAGNRSAERERTMPRGLGGIDVDHIEKG